MHGCEPLHVAGQAKAGRECMAASGAVCGRLHSTHSLGRGGRRGGARPVAGGLRWGEECEAPVGSVVWDCGEGGESEGEREGVERGSEGGLGERGPQRRGRERVKVKER